MDRRYSLNSADHLLGGVVLGGWFIMRSSLNEMVFRVYKNSYRSKWVSKFLRG